MKPALVELRGPTGATLWTETASLENFRESASTVLPRKDKGAAAAGLLS